LTTFAWIPLIVWCALAGVSARASAVAIAMSFLAGEPFFAAVGALLFAVARRRGVRDLIDVALTSFAVSSIQLLPFLSMVLSSDRAHGGVTRAQMFQDSMPLRDWLRMAIPPNLGANPFDPRLGQHFIPIVYVGVLTVVFAMIGVVIGRRRALGWIALVILCVLIGAGSHFGPGAEVMARLPLTLFRYPARVVPLAVLAICALAAIGCDRVIRGRWQFAIALVMFIDVALQLQPVLITAKFDPHRVPYPQSIGRDAKILRIDMLRHFDRDGWISGYLNLYDRRFDVWTAAPIVSQRYSMLFQSILARRDLAGIDALSAGYILAPGPLAAFEPVAAVRGAVVHRNRGTFPLAYFRDDITHRIAHVMSLAFTPSSVFIDVDAPADGDVIVTQQAAPGWLVTVDGKTANQHESSLFRAVHVARGRHAIKWTYRPVPLLIGAILTFGGLVRLLFSSWFVKRGERIKFLRASRENA
ncbi:MAG: YfhO family protein, partial [Acidobacteriota bacterium]|nr:YfhO family protein [Acidobacteriota bacterium]